MAAVVIQQNSKNAWATSCMSCCLFGTVLTMCRCFWYNGDRQAMATKYNIEDPYSGCTACMLFMCGCGGCLLCQEYNTMKKFQASGVQPFANNTVVITSPPAAIGVPVVAGGQAPHY